MAVNRPRKTSTTKSKTTANATATADIAPRFMLAPAERWQHNEREPASKIRDSIQRPQRLRTIVGTLLASGRIGGAEHAAAARWVRDYELGHHHARHPECVGSGTGSPDGIPIAICDAQSRDREATLALGSRGTAVMILIGHRSISLTSLARHLDPTATGKNVNAATKLAVETLSTLTAHLRRNRQPQPPPAPSVGRPRARSPPSRLQRRSGPPWRSRQREGISPPSPVLVGTGGDTAHVAFATSADVYCPHLLERVLTGKTSILEARAWWSIWGVRCHAVEIDLREGIVTGAIHQSNVPRFDGDDLAGYVVACEALIDATYELKMAA